MAPNLFTFPSLSIESGTPLFNQTVDSQSNFTECVKYGRADDPTMLPATGHTFTDIFPYFGRKIKSLFCYGDLILDTIPSFFPSIFGHRIENTECVAPV